MKSSNSLLSQNAKQNRFNSMLLSKNYVHHIFIVIRISHQKGDLKILFYNNEEIQIYKNLSPVKYTFFELRFFSLAG